MQRLLTIALLFAAFTATRSIETLKSLTENVVAKSLRQVQLSTSLVDDEVLITLYNNREAPLKNFFITIKREK